MLLPDHRIEELCNTENGKRQPLIEPFNNVQLQPASYDLTLERQFCFPGANESPFAAKTVTLRPGKMILGCTRERIAMPTHLAGSVEGRSGNARRGISVEAAGHVDPGYCGVITLEIYNFGDAPMILGYGMGIAKIVFAELSEPCKTPYSAQRNRHQYLHGPSPI